MKDDLQSNITIRRIKKAHKDEAHSSAWKVALADFAIAMMAFFLLMWLINMATQDERRAISGYFEKPEQFTPPSDLPPSSVIVAKEKQVPIDKLKQREDIGHYKNEKIKEIFAQEERKKLEDLMALLQKKIEDNEILKKYKEHIKLDMTEMGLRVQVIDQEERSMFDRSSDILKDYAVKILMNLAVPLNEVPNRISIAGHTDAHPFFENELSNWELSANRANAARRALISGGLKPGKVARVVGLADTLLYVKENPMSAVNRRISIIILTREQSFYE